MAHIPDDWLWIVIVGFIVSFLLAFGIGANDVANSFGTSVGSKVLTLFKACVLGCIFEVLGAILIGYRVSDTIRKGIVDVTTYNNSEKLLLMGNLSALSGSCIWLFIATFLRLPVSATHSVVGATIGFSLVARGPKGVGWIQLGKIVASWFVSPVMSGIISALLFMLVRSVVLRKEKPLVPGLKLLPLFYGVTILINAISVFLDGSELLYFDHIPIYGTFIISIGLAVITAIIVRIFAVPWLKKKIADQQDAKELCNSNNGTEKLCELTFNDMGDGEVKDVEKAHDTSVVTRTASGDATKLLPQPGNDVSETVFIEKPNNGVPGGDSLPETPYQVTALLNSTSNTCQGDYQESCKSSDFSDTKETHAHREMSRATIEDTPETVTLFSFLQILTAVFGSFAHGGNDVSNAIGPLVGLWVISTEQNVAQKAATPIWILVFGGVGISVGLCVLGRRVIKTMGEDLSKITPSSGFCIEVGAAMTVLLATYAKIPVSTTHCKVGSIVFVGRVRSNDNVDWSLFRNIIIAWVVTLPTSGLLSALAMFLLKEFAL